jgi:PPOX class probable F420-dependent enzyme
MALPLTVIRLAKGPSMATVVTLMPDGTPQAQLTWIDTDGEVLLVNTEPQRQRVRNLQRDPRVTVLIQGDSPWDWAEVRGRLAGTVEGQVARDHVDELSHRYLGVPYQSPIGPRGRVILQIAPEKVNTP